MLEFIGVSLEVEREYLCPFYYSYLLILALKIFTGTLCESDNSSFGSATDFLLEFFLVKACDLGEGFMIKL